MPRHLLAAMLVLSFASVAHADVVAAGSFIRNQKTRQPNAVLNISSGTIDTLRTSTITFQDGSQQTSAASGSAYVRSGFSSRFSESVSVVTAAGALDQILALSYLGPQVSLSGSPSNTVRETGVPLASIGFSAFTVKRSSPITSVAFQHLGVTFATVGSPNPNGGTETATYAVPISTTTSFTATANDGTTNTLSNTYQYTFVYPFYYGVGAPGLTGVQVAALTKLVQTKQDTNTTTSPSTQVFYFSYPQSYGSLTSILDANNFETISGYTLRTASITGADSVPVTYNIYEYNTLTTQTSFVNHYKF